MADLLVDAQKPSYDVGYLMQGAITHVPLTPVHWGIEMAFATLEW